MVQTLKTVEKQCAQMKRDEALAGTGDNCCEIITTFIKIHKKQLNVNGVLLENCWKTNMANGKPLGNI